MIFTPQSRQESLMIIIIIGDGVFIIIYNDIFPGFFVPFIIWFIIFIWVIPVNVGIHFCKLGTVKQILFPILLAIVISQKFLRVTGFVLVNHSACIRTNGDHNPAGKPYKYKQNT